MIYQYFCNRCMACFFDSKKSIGDVVCPVCDSSKMVEFLQKIGVD